MMNGILMQVIKHFKMGHKSLIGSIVKIAYNGLAMHRMKHSVIWGIAVVTCCTGF